MSSSIPTVDAAHPFGRVLTAMITPFDADLKVDLKAAKRVARYLVDGGNDGLVLSGTTGESPTTHGPEKAALIEAVAEEVGDEAYIMAGACSNDTAHAVRMAQSAADAGADGLLVVTPYYNRPSQEGLFRHFETVSGSTELPVMVYDIPGRTGLAIADDTMDRLAGIEQIKAVKDATGDPVLGLARAARTGLAWYSGDDGLNLSFLALGAAGVVSVVGHVAGQRWADLVRAIDAEDLAEARRIHEATAPVVRGIMGGGIGAVMVKAALELHGVVGNRLLRLPNIEATPEQVAQVRAALAEAGIAAPAA